MISFSLHNLLLLALTTTTTLMEARAHPEGQGHNVNGGGNNAAMSHINSLISLAQSGNLPGAIPPIAPELISTLIPKLSTTRPANVVTVSSNTGTSNRFSRTSSGGGNSNSVVITHGKPVNPPPLKTQADVCRAGFSVRKGLVKPDQETRSGRVYFQDVISNVGGWKTDSQQFEAPCSGFYYFIFHAVSTQDQDFTIALMKEGVYQVTAYGSKDKYQWGSNSALLFLNAGERVYLELQQGNIYEHPFDEAYNTFTGFLVNQV